MNDQDIQLPDTQSWRLLYESAILELDTRVIPQRIEEAQRAIGERAIAILRDSNAPKAEQQDLAGAYLALDQLKRIYPIQSAAEAEHQIRGSLF